MMDFFALNIGINDEKTTDSHCDSPPFGSKIQVTTADVQP